MAEHGGEPLRRPFLLEARAVPEIAQGEPRKTGQRPNGRGEAAPAQGSRQCFSRFEQFRNAPPADGYQRIERSGVGNAFSLGPE